MCEREREHTQGSPRLSHSLSLRSCCISFPKLFRPGVKCNHIDKASTRLDLTSLRARVALCRIPACVFLSTHLPPSALCSCRSGVRLQAATMVANVPPPPLSRPFLSLHPFSCHVCPCVRSFLFPFLQSHCLAWR